jgi:type II secretory pathway pseudopilin PulG
LKKLAMNRNGFTFLTAIFMVMIIGVMLGLTGRSWSTIMKREREKELLFRGSQIKEAIENWYNPNYSVQGVRRQSTIPLMDLKDLLQDNMSLSKLKYLPQSYAASLDGNNQKCAPNCAKQKIYEDPMTGKEWTVIRGNFINGQPVSAGSGVQGAGIIGVASKSEEEPMRTDFKDTALENMGAAISAPAPVVTGAVPMLNPAVTTTLTPVLGKMTKYSEWKFVADKSNDHRKIYRAYHEGW